MMKDKYPLSPYEYNENRQMDVLQNKRPKEIKIQGNEAAIIRVLAKYRLLTKSGITTATNRLLPEKRRKPTFDKEISLLFEGGYIKKYCYRTSSNGRENVTAFALAENGIKYATEKQMRFFYDPIKDNNKYTTHAVLEILALNRWHIRLLETYSSFIQSEGYQTPARGTEEKNMIIPSRISFINEDWSLLKQFTIIALPYTKDETIESKGTFLNSLMLINSFLNANRKSYKLSFIVTLVDSFEQMERARALIRSYKPLAKLCVYYAIDEFVNDENPLKWLYEVTYRESDNAIRYDLIDFTQPQ